MRSVRWIVAVAVAAISLAVLGAEPSLHREKSFSPKPGGTVRVEAAFQDVVVTVRPGASVEVTVDVKVSGWGGSDEDFLKACEPQFSETADAIVVHCKPSVHFTFGLKTTLAKIDVKMPPGMGIEASSGSGDCSVKGDTGGFPVSISTGSGDVLLDGACKSLQAETGSGDVKASFSKDAEKAEFRTGSGDVLVSGPVQELSAETGSGDVRLELKGGKAKVSLRTGSGDADLKGGAVDLTARSGSGEITADGLTGAATLKTGSGDISATWAQGPHGEKLSAKSSSGSVHLAFPAGTGLAGLLTSVSGRIHSDFPGAPKGSGEKSFALTGSQGSSDLEVETISGDIHVVAAK